MSMGGIWINPHRSVFDHPLIRALVLSLDGDHCDWSSSDFVCQMFTFGPAGERLPCTLSVRATPGMLRVEAQDGQSTVIVLRPSEWWTVDQVAAVAALMDGPLRPAFELIDDALVLMRHPGGEE